MGALKTIESNQEEFERILSKVIVKELIRRLNPPTFLKEKIFGEVFSSIEERGREALFLYFNWCWLTEGKKSSWQNEVLMERISELPLETNALIYEICNQQLREPHEHSSAISKLCDHLDDRHRLKFRPFVHELKCLYSKQILPVYIQFAIYDLLKKASEGGDEQNLIEILKSYVSPAHYKPAVGEEIFEEFSKESIKNHFENHNFSQVLKVILDNIKPLIEAAKAQRKEKKEHWKEIMRNEEEKRKQEKAKNDQCLVS